MSKNREKEIKAQIVKLQYELDMIRKEEAALEFVNLLRQVLSNNKCSIVLQGSEEWQFNKKYYIRDISYNIRKKIIEVLEIIYDKPNKENEK